MKKSFLSFLLICIMIFSMLPSTDVTAEYVLSATCTDYTVLFEISGATLLEGEAMPDGNNGLLNMIVTDATDHLTIIPKFYQSDAEISKTTPESVVIDLCPDVAEGEFDVFFTDPTIENGKWLITVIILEPDGSEPASLTFLTDLYEDEIIYMQGEKAEELTVFAKQSNGETVTYQWYSNTNKNTEDGIAILGANDQCYIPPTDAVGTVYYYVVASCGVISVKSGVAKITVGDNPLVERIEITKKPKNTTYIAGENFDPSGMEVTVYYGDGSSAKTEDYIWTPAGQLTTEDSAITVKYTGSDATYEIQPATVSIVVNERYSGGGDDDYYENTEPQYDSIKVYMTFVNRGEIIVQDENIEIFDEDMDGKYCIGDAFRVLHQKYYPDGESGYKEISGNGVNGWVAKFWGKSDATFTYSRNYRWAKSTNDEIADGDIIAAINGIDEIFYSDLYTWFDKSSYSVQSGSNVKFKVNGLNLMASKADYDSLHFPTGATVTVFDETSNEISDMTTVVASDGTFTLKFTDNGKYTVKVSGNAEWGSYMDAPVAPSFCTVNVSNADNYGGNGGGSYGGGEETEDITVTQNSYEKITKVSNEEIDKAIIKAKQENSSFIEFMAEIKDDVNQSEISFPIDSLKLISDSGLGLGFNTSFAKVQFPPNAVTELATQNEELIVTLFGNNDEVSIDVSVGGKKIEKLNGGLKVVLPDENNGNVMVTVNKDGSETIVTKHLIKDKEHQAKLSGCATIKMIDNYKEFSDSKGHWGEESIKFVTERELYQGVGDGKFDTEGNMTRAMLVAVLHRLEGETEDGFECDFDDIDEEMWYSDSVAWANANGIVKGVFDNLFNPDSFVTREQVATILYRYAKYLELPTNRKGDLTQFSDYDKISDWSKDASAWAIGVGIVSGKPDKVFDSNGNATRTEVAAILERLITFMVKNP